LVTPSISAGDPLLQQRLEQLVGEGAAAFYADAVSIIQNESLATRDNLIGHLMREIDSALLQAATPIVGPQTPRTEAPSDGPVPTTENRRARAEAVARRLGLPADDPVVATWTSRRFDRAAHRNNLGPPRPFDPEAWTTYERFLGLALDRVEALYDLVTGRLDELLASGHRGGQQGLLCTLPPGARSAALRHFFDRAPSAWVNVLPACIRLTPAVATFAARIASEQPRAVAGLIVDIAAAHPVEPYVHGDLAAAAAALPGASAARWARIEANWLLSQASLPSLPSFRYIDAIDHLLEEGQVEAALDLLESMLALGQPQGSVRDLDIRVSGWDYEEIIEGPVARAIVVAPRATLRMLLPILALGAERAEANTRLSGFWLHAVADHPQDRRATPLILLTRAVRDAAATVAKADGPEVALQDVVEHAASSRVLRRIGLFVIRSVGSADLATEWLVDRSTHHHDFSRDAYELVFDLRTAFDKDQRERLLRALEEEPWDRGVRDAIRVLLETGESESELDPDLGLLFAVHSVERPRSPFTPEQLNARSVRDVVDLVLDVAADDDSFDRADVTPVLQAAVAAEPQQYVDDARQLTRLPMHVVSTAIYGFAAALGQKVEVHWTPWLRVAVEAVDLAGAWRSEDARDVRHALVSFATTFASQGDARERDDLRLLARLVEVLADEPAPVADRERARSDEGLLDVMISETRPSAVHAAIFVAWAARRDDALRAEVLEFLARRTDAALEPSLSVRAALGFELPVLIAVDASWVAANQDALFPIGPSSVAQRLAVWDAYVQSHQHARFPSYSQLRREWQRWAEGLIGTLRPTDDLAAQLTMIQYWHGQLAIDDPIVDALLRNGSSNLLESTIRWIGWQISIVGQADPTVGSRLRTLWEARSGSGSQSLDERASFGQWFAGEVLDQSWALDELERLAADRVQFSDLDAVVAALARHLSGDVVRVARVADQAIANETEWSRMSTAEPEIFALVEALEAQQEPEAADKGRSIRNRMVVRGFRGFALDAANVAAILPPRRRRRARRGSATQDNAGS
jgi:hypothetical protein